MLYAAGASILGLQLMIFALLARAIGCIKGVMPMTTGLERYWRHLTLERGIAAGLLIGCAGFALAIRSVELWLVPASAPSIRRR